MRTFSKSIKLLKKLLEEPELLDLRLDEEVELQKELINISDLTNEIIQSYKDSADYHGITIISSIASNIMLNTNLQAYTQLLNVLMDNAMKYTTEKGEVCLNLTQDAKNVIINEENTCDRVCGLRCCDSG